MVGEWSNRGNVFMGKYPVGEVSVKEFSGQGIAQLGNCPLKKCQSGIRPRKSVSRGIVQSGDCPTIIHPTQAITPPQHII